MRAASRPGHDSMRDDLRRPHGAHRHPGVERRGERGRDAPLRPRAPGRWPRARAAGGRYATSRARPSSRSRRHAVGGAPGVRLGAGGEAALGPIELGVGRRRVARDVTREPRRRESGLAGARGGGLVGGGAVEIEGLPGVLLARLDAPHALERGARPAVCSSTARAPAPSRTARASMDSASASGSAARGSSGSPPSARARARATPRPRRRRRPGPIADPVVRGRSRRDGSARRGADRRREPEQAIPRTRRRPAIPSRGTFPGGHDSAMLPRRRATCRNPR